MKPSFAKISKEIKSLSKEILQINKTIFEKPELNYEEVESASLLTAKLESEGFKVKRGKRRLKTAFDAEWVGKTKKPTVALIAEYDALPNIGHACGHNLIASASYGAAVAVKNLLGENCGRLKVIGTPAEEGGGGKLLMIKDGWFKGVDAAMMVHPSNKTRAVARMLAVMEVRFCFYGKASHAAAHPELGLNALDAVINLFNSVNALRQQTPDFSRVHGIITHGGDAPNIIPEYAEAKFMIRGLTMPDFDYMVKRVFDCARGAAKTSGCKLKIISNPLVYHPFEPNRSMGKVFAKHFKSAGLIENGPGETKEIGSSDIGNLSQVVPSLHPEFAVGDGTAVNHSRDFLEAVVSKEGTGNMLKAATAMAATAIDIFFETKLLNEIKDEFKQLHKN